MMEDDGKREEMTVIKRSNSPRITESEKRDTGPKKLGASPIVIGVFRQSSLSKAFSIPSGVRIGEAKSPFSVSKLAPLKIIDESVLKAPMGSRLSIIIVVRS